MATVRCAFVLQRGVLAAVAQAAMSTNAAQEEAGTAAVEVPVFVLDGAGNPVTDLRPEDFRVYEDGKPQSLLFAQRVKTQSAVQPSAGATPAETPTRYVGESLEAPRRFVLLFDLIFNSLAGIKRAREGAWKFVANELTSNDAVAVFSFSNAAGMVMCTNITTDRQRTWQALNSLGAKQSVGSESSAGLASGRLSPGASWSGIGPSTGTHDRSMERLLESFVISDAEELSIHFESLKMLARDMYQATIREYMVGLQEMARSLDVLLGRKFVVLFSSGFDMARAFVNWSSKEEAPMPPTPSTSAMEARLRGDSTSGMPVPDLMQSTVDAMLAFSSSSCRLYAVDTGGLPPAGNPSAGTWKSPAKSLEYLAEQAGGHSFCSLNVLDKQLIEIGKETGSYYVLAYEPPPARGKRAYHKITLEVARPGVSISYRRGY